MAISREDLILENNQIDSQLADIESQIQSVRNSQSDPDFNRQEAFQELSNLRARQDELQVQKSNNEASIRQIEQNRRNIGLDPETGEPLPEPEEEPVEEEPVEDVQSEADPVVDEQTQPSAEQEQTNQTAQEEKTPSQNSNQQNSTSPDAAGEERQPNNNVTSDSEDIRSSQASNNGLPIDNPLNAFSSFNSIFTFGVAATSQLGSSQRQDPASIVIKSGGTTNQQVKTAAEQSLGITAEYFIEDVNIESIISPTSRTRQTNATKITFTVREPYSMGNFLQTLAVAALEQGYTSYIDAGWILTVEFLGYDDQGRAITVENTKRYFPLKLTNVTFSVTAGGSEYSVEAIPYNEQALSDEVQALKEDVDIKGITVADFLNLGINGNDSLQDVLNSRDEKAVEAGQKKASDFYIFSFTDETGAPTGNKIGDAKISTSAYSSGNQLFGDVEEVEDGVFQRNNITLYPEERRLNFKKGTRIQEIIEELIILSDYGRNLINQEPDADGMKEWFKIRPVSYPAAATPENVQQRGRYGRIYWYQIEVYKYHSSKTNSPSIKSPGIENLKNKAVKEYNYIYSGKNDDILDFELQFDASFFQALQSDIGQLGQDQTVGGSDKIVENEETPVTKTNDGAPPSIRGIGPVNTVEDYPNTNTGGIGGPAEQNSLTAIARSFNEAITNGIDLITMNLSILGDPYYIADEGVGNYTTETSNLSPNINEDGSISYSRREVDILLNFRTPIDIGKNGLMTFPAVESQPVGQFSGLYQVVTVRNEISANKFTQELQLIRRRNQTGNEAQNSGLVTEGTAENAVGEIPDAPTGVITDEQRRSTQGTFEQSADTENILELLQESRASVNSAQTQLSGGARRRLNREADIDRFGDSDIVVPGTNTTEINDLLRNNNQGISGGAARRARREAGL